jgi:hypothetical protein
MDIFEYALFVNFVASTIISRKTKICAKTAFECHPDKLGGGN